MFWNCRGIAGFKNVHKTVVCFSFQTERQKKSQQNFYNSGNDYISECPIWNKIPGCCVPEPLLVQHSMSCQKQSHAGKVSLGR